MKYEGITIECSEGVVLMADTLLATGLWGKSREEVLQRMLEQNCDVRLALCGILDKVGPNVNGSDAVERVHRGPRGRGGQRGPVGGAQ